MSDFDDMLLEAAAEIGRDSWDASLSPNEAQVGGYINDGLFLEILALCPRRNRAGVWLPGRLDKLAKITTKETYTIAGGYAELPCIPLPTVEGSGFTPNPATGAAAFFSSIRVGAAADEAARVPAQERPLGEVWTKMSGATYAPALPYAAPASAPVFAWGTFAVGGAGGTPGIIIAPQPTAGTDAVDFYYIKIPARLAQGGSEDWPLDNDLRALDMDYTRMMIRLTRNNLDLRRAAFYRKSFIGGIADLLGVKS